MFNILVYLYETYYRPDACPDSIALAKKLSAIGFEDDEIVEALDWLNGLDSYNQQVADVEKSPVEPGFRVYTEAEYSRVGAVGIGFIAQLSAIDLLDWQQREIVLERAMAVDESPISLEKLKIIVLMLLWSQGREPDLLLFDDLLLLDENQEPRPLH
ncbi:DUF494 domain-containing protein [Undibacterium sp. LX40W]|uniref:Protein Smg homolog n=1 Tax=Undibacterium nitidum TaxID=2762298 RepID=A0A923HSS2_9BURK|nr:MULTISPECIES: DUF494 domain-containing protein [Undibacterium]MBC3883431.1 DUF494 domain-containing protein [Undibacterium nitidum]MBC3893713.1 DUF494 domain-containing protein [Undibacterium sp. LX40W]